MKRILSVIISVMLIIGMMPLGISASDGDLPSQSSFAGKSVSILSHSASTYAGVSNDTNSNSTIGNNDVYYTEGRYGVYRKDTWWQQTADALGMELLVNNSWSGSCIFTPRKGAASVGYGDRAVNLHNDHTGEEPDIIFIYLGCNDFAYYKDTFGTSDGVDYASLITDNGGTFSYAEPTTACEAYAIMLHKVKTRYPGADIYCMTSTARREVDYTGDSYPDAGQPTEYSAQLKVVAAHFGFPVVDLENAIPKNVELFDLYMGDKRAHPNALGMDRITEEVLSVMLGTDAEIRHVTSDDGTVKEQAVLLGGTYSAQVGSGEGLSVKVTMGGEDVTDTVYSNGRIFIENVTGDISVKTALRSYPLNFRWEAQNDDLLSVGEKDNELSLISGTVTDGVLDNARFQLSFPVILRHDLPWEVEWRIEGNWRGCIFSSDPAQTKNMLYLSRTVGGQLSFGTWTGKRYDNYGVDLSYLDDGAHTVRLENRIGDGGNMVWVYVDGTQIGPTDRYHIGSNYQGQTDDWVSGKDFVFNYIGIEGHALRDGRIYYLQVKECVHDHVPYVTDPTCTESGHTMYVCSYCNDTYVDTIPPLGHGYEEHKGEDGLIRCFCSRCGAEKEFIPGDCNGDGAVDGLDLIILRRYLAVYDFDTGKCSVGIMICADISGDGTVNGIDLIRLRKYLVNSV